MTSSGMLVEWAGVGEPQSLVCKSIGGLYADLSPEDFFRKKILNVTLVGILPLKEEVHRREIGDIYVHSMTLGFVGSQIDLGSAGGTLIAVLDS